MAAVLHRFSRGPFELVILGLLGRSPMHGYQIIRTLGESKGGALDIICIDEGTLYPLLYRLEKKGLIRGRWKKVGTKRKRHCYAVTPRGREELKFLQMCWKSLTRAVDCLMADCE